MSKIINIILGIVAAALIAGMGVLIYFHFKPGPPTALDIAYQQWQSAVNKNPDDAFSRANLAGTLADMGRNDEAVEQFKTALDQDPKNVEYMLKLGLLFRKMNNLDSAMDMFTKASDTASAGQKYEYQYEAAQTAFDKGDLNAAADYAQRSVKDNDTLWNTHDLLGQIYEKQGDKAKAKTEYEAAAKFNPDNQDLQDSIKRVSG